MFLSSFLSFKTKYKILLFLKRFRKNNLFENITFDGTKKKAFFFLAADYGNLGDCAITYAQKRFIEENSDYEVVEIPISKTAEGLIYVKKHIKQKDIIVTVGGGNMGDLYDQIEFFRQLVIKNFPKNKIISFPQTFDFSESEQGEKALQKAISIYSNHENLTIVARERISYQLMQKYFTKNKVILTPDIVLSLNKYDAEAERKGVVFCLRNDEEKAISKEENSEIIDLVKTSYSKSEFYDTHIGKGNLSTQERERELEKIWDKFKSAELVITDRLHGMIFCYITNTPCIVFPNNNHKVKETVNWFPANSNIILLEKYSKENLIAAINQQKNYKGIFQPINQYTPLTEILK